MQIHIVLPMIIKTNICAVLENINGKYSCSLKIIVNNTFKVTTITRDLFLMISERSKMKTAWPNNIFRKTYPIIFPAKEYGLNKWQECQ